MKTLVALLLAHAMAVVAAAAPSGFIKNPDNGHYYKAVHVPKGISWSAAKAEAEKAGGYLATVTSERENTFIKRIINQEELWISNSLFDNFGPWIGGYQEKGAGEPDQGWKWVTGEDFFYASWAPMEPSGRWKGKNENRLQFYCKSNRRRYAKWNDAVDSPKDVTIQGYVIEKGEIQTEPREILVTEPLLELHEFTGTNGQNSHGKVVAYSPNNNIVTIEKDNKRHCKIGLAHLSTTDQSYVHEWYLVKEFCTPSRIRITAKEKKCANDREMEFHDGQGNYVALQTVESIGYELVLDNRIGADLPQVEIEYCIYFEQDRPKSVGRISVGQGVKCGTMDLGTLAAGAKVQLDTEPATLFKRQKERGPIELLQGKIHGIWIRVYLPLADGRRAMIEYATPKKITKERKWATSDVSVLTDDFLRHSMRNSKPDN